MTDEPNELDDLQKRFQAEQANALSQDATREDVAWLLWTEGNGAAVLKAKAQTATWKALAALLVCLAVVALAVAFRVVIGGL